MILKGNQRGGGQQLAAHLMNSFDNERVEIADMRGAVAQDLSGAFAEWVGAGPRHQMPEKPLQPFAQSRPGAGPPHPRTIPRTARPHRAQPEAGRPAARRRVPRKTRQGRRPARTLPCRLVAHRHRQNESRADRARPPEAAHRRAGIRPRPRAGVARRHEEGRQAATASTTARNRKTSREKQQQERTGISKAERMADIAACWKETGNGAAFVQALGEQRVITSRSGDRRAFVVVDLYGEVHSLSRQLEGVRSQRTEGPPLRLPVGQTARRRNRAGMGEEGTGRTPETAGQGNPPKSKSAAHALKAHQQRPPPADSTRCAST